MYDKVLMKQLRHGYMLTQEGWQVVERALFTDGIPYPDVRKMVKAGGCASNIRALCKAYLEEVDLGKLLSLLHEKDGDQEIAVYARALKEGVDMSKILLFADGTHTAEQSEEILEGFLSGRSVVEMEPATDNRLDGWQIAEICDGFRQGLTYEQVEVYARECFDHYQMRLIKECLLQGFTLQEVASFANPWNNTKVMGQSIERIREKHM